jgi:hypothetical protein
VWNYFGSWLNSSFLTIPFQLQPYTFKAGIATGYGFDHVRIGFRVTVRPTMFSTPYRSEGLWGPPSLLFNGEGGEGSISEIKRPGSEADHSTKTNAEVKKTWIYTPTSLYDFMAQCLLN